MTLTSKHKFDLEIFLFYANFMSIYAKIIEKIKNVF